ncbi:recombinase family protein [Lactobacillus sp. LC28-10]|uniref:Recombinase family protein n=1 Tax=Secundilactobacillus angelensis TaxID=2722706 RepID=A0ABX1KWS8_9LACO|nr:recombinase family protein [Secundilactobacillus angelensis]MCH5461326.1 recombinase family protein [Secundilactobacillus angelensis]NLR17478.1 recombinase family protein [Secundilactobacillus angelensis]
MIYGYARVSTKDQNLARQIQALSDLGVDRIFKEKASGSNLSRPILKKLLALLKPDDVIKVLSLDRLGRNANDVTNVIIEIRSKGANIDFLDIPSYEDVRDENTRNLLSSITIELQKYLAAEERKKILERQRQGIALAKLRGVYQGRPILYGPNVSNSDRRKTYFEIKRLLKADTPVRRIQQLTGRSITLIQRIKREL